jgi:hypothetical protein
MQFPKDQEVKQEVGSSAKLKLETPDSSGRRRPIESDFISFYVLCCAASYRKHS